MAAAVAMAAPPGKKLSFAKVAASGTKEPPSAAAIARSPAPATAKEPRVPASTVPAASSSPAPVTVANGTTVAMTPPIVSGGRNPHKTPVAINESKVVEGLRDLKLETKTPNLVVNGTGSTVTERSSKTGNSQTPSDEVSQRADSVSELDTKPPSLDGKSITSGTTFAMDEKESLRPDDSASVKAAAEDDDAFSIRGSLVAGGSRMGSEVAARVHRIQLGDMPPRTITTHVLIGPHSQGVVAPQTGVPEKPAVPEANLPLVSAAVGPDGISNGFYQQNPDDKLLEAMQSPKDRLFLLRLEAQVIEFVQDSKEPFMDLPPCNSFCRMLTHKLADYYHMTHSFEAVAGAVRIYRTPFCRVPPPLSSIVVNPSNTASPAPALLPRRIMRRDRDGELGSLSAGPSKPTSEDGSDSKEKGAATKEKPTREEREEAYNKARERIFGSLEKIETSAPGEHDDSNGVSRASSVSARDKSSQAKRKTAKQRRDDSESFDSRSKYVAWCGPQQQTWMPPQYMPLANPQFNGPFQQPRPNTIQPAYAPNPQYPQVIPNNGYAPQYNAIPQVEYPPQAPAQPAPPVVPQQQRYPAQSVAAAPYPPAMPPAVPQQGWQQQPSQSPYQSRATPAAPGIPYMYGQLPVNVNPNDPKSQHPIPGSYNRHAFNPKTQSFVPANGMAPMVPPTLPYGGGSPHHGSPQFHALPVNYTGYQQPIPQPPYMGTAPGYGMARQGSNNSIPQYHPGQMQPQPIPHGPPTHGPQVNQPIQPPHIPNKPAMPQGPAQTFSTLPTYGNPATLPQKPST